MNNLNLDYAVECVKTLADNNRCVTCDQLNGPGVRYPCGHTVCKNCALIAVDCLRCLSLPSNSTKLTDVPYSLRIKHVSTLLTTFQDLFQLDVYKRSRLSEQLKLEKQLFPECIQAPLKYCNKRKGINSANDKENFRVLVLPGEHTSNTLIMENNINYVQQWLNKNESNLRMSNTNLPRKPFAVLNANSKNVAKEHSNLFTKIEDTGECSRKRTHIKVLKSSKKSNINRTKKKHESDSNTKQESIKKQKMTLIQKSKCENDESGIVIDDQTIVIEDSQMENIDKDKLALIAIQDAEELNSCDTSNSDTSENKIKLRKNILTLPINEETYKSSLYKTPFYKKSLLHKINNVSTNEISENKDNSRDIIITIDNKNFTTTVKFSQLSNNIKVYNGHSVQVQTDDIYVKDMIHAQLEKDSGINDSTIISQKNDENLKSDDLFNENVETENNQEIFGGTVNPRAKYVVIEDSDVDSDIQNHEDNKLEVTADVHRSYDDPGVLSTLDPKELENRKRHAARGYTPLSTDSSDKENYDPNRIKRRKIAKKNCNKK